MSRSVYFFLVLIALAAVEGKHLRHGKNVNFVRVNEKENKDFEKIKKLVDELNEVTGGTKYNVYQKETVLTEEQRSKLDALEKRVKAIAEKIKEADKTGEIKRYGSFKKGDQNIPIKGKIIAKNEKLFGSNKQSDIIIGGIKDGIPYPSLSVEPFFKHIQDVIDYPEQPKQQQQQQQKEEQQIFLQIKKIKKQVDSIFGKQRQQEISNTKSFPKGNTISDKEYDLVIKNLQKVVGKVEAIAENMTKKD